MGEMLRQCRLHQVDPSDLPLRRRGRLVRRRLQGLPAGEVVEAASLRVQRPVHRPARAQVQTLTDRSISVSSRINKTQQLIVPSFVRVCCS
uniref:Uncharacterized protein n=1 Tax=Oryza brachyantha TaxID=4533 RepID=J3KUQ1_ORYBR